MGKINPPVMFPVGDPHGIPKRYLEGRILYMETGELSVLPMGITQETPSRNLFFREGAPVSKPIPGSGLDETDH